MREKVKELLGMNLPANVVATAVGLSEAAISQMMSEEVFAAEVVALRIANTTAHAARDRVYDSVEDRLLELLEEKLESGLIFTKPHEILSAIRIINGAKRRASPAELGTAVAQQNFLSLQLPEGAEFTAKFVVNKKNQVIEIAGRPIATMGAKQVVKQLEKMNAEGSGVATVNPINIEQNKADEVEAEMRLDNLVKLENLPVAELL